MSSPRLFLSAIELEDKSEDGADAPVVVETADNSEDNTAPDAPVSVDDKSEDNIGAAAPIATAEDEAVPHLVEAMDGVQSEEEAHNMERPARKSIAKKRSPAKPLSDFAVGETVTGTVRTLTNYGAFLDFGGESDGLVHISNLSREFVSDVSSILSVGQEIPVRILEINVGKKQVGLTLLTEEEETDQQQANANRQNNSSSNNRRASNNNTSDLLAQLQAINVDPSKFVAGTVVNTVDFGAFVRVDCSQFSEEITGSLDGLVHISALANNRVSSVTDVVKEGQDVQVRLKGIDGAKVALSMVSLEEEQAKMDARGSAGAEEEEEVGNVEWRQDYDRIKEGLPEFRNSPMVVTK